VKSATLSCALGGLSHHVSLADSDRSSFWPLYVRKILQEFHDILESCQLQCFQSAGVLFTTTRAIYFQTDPDMWWVISTQRWGLWVNHQAPINLQNSSILNSWAIHFLGRFWRMGHYLAGFCWVPHEFNSRLLLEHVFHRTVLGIQHPVYLSQGHIICGVYINMWQNISIMLL